MTSPLIACRELVERATDYVESVLSTAERLRFEAHLRECKGCRTYVQQMRQVVRSLRQLAQEAVDQSVKQALLRAFRDWRATSSG